VKCKPPALRAQGKVVNFSVGNSGGNVNFSVGNSGGSQLLIHVGADWREPSGEPAQAGRRRLRGSYPLARVYDDVVGHQIGAVGPADAFVG